MACNFIKKETLERVFSFEFYEIYKNTFLQNTSGRLFVVVTFSENTQTSYFVEEV